MQLGYRFVEACLMSSKLFFLFKKTSMKKNLISAILVSTSILFAVSCSKSDNVSPPPGGTSPQGKWIGNHNNGIGGPLFYFELNLNANSVLQVKANNDVTPDIANGTWTLVADSVRALSKNRIASPVRPKSARPSPRAVR